MDGGDIWASVECVVPPVGKSDLYRGEIADAALTAVLLAVERFASGTHTPRPQGPAHAEYTPVRIRPYLDQGVRRIDWHADSTETVLRKLRAADSQPGVLDVLCGAEWYLHGGHPEGGLRGAPELLATLAGDLPGHEGRRRVDPQLRRRRASGRPPTYKLPAGQALGDRLPSLPELAAPDLRGPAPAHLDGHRVPGGGSVGVLSVPRPRRRDEHHAVPTPSRRLPAGVRAAHLGAGAGGSGTSSPNGIHLNVIEAAEDPAAESWANINAIDDLCRGGPDHPRTGSWSPRSRATPRRAG